MELKRTSQKPLQRTAPPPDPDPEPEPEKEFVSAMDQPTNFCWVCGRSQGRVRLRVVIAGDLAICQDCDHIERPRPTLTRRPNGTDDK